MKTRQVVLIFFFVGIFLNACQVVTPADPREYSYQRFSPGHSEDCVDRDLGIRFHCNPNWTIQSNPDSLTVIMSASPEVLFTIEKTNFRIGFLSQINELSLESMQRYAKGFGIEHNTIANRETLKVKAFSKKNPEVRLSEYYLIHNLNLYRISFSVKPKDEWDNYKFLIKNIIESFDFI